MTPAFGILQFGRRETENVATDIGDVIRLARLAEELGFERFWLTQHFDERELWGDPVPMLTLIAAATRTINVGPGGMLLRTALIANLASTFKFLAAMFPGRIDLGLVSARVADGPSSRDFSRELVDDETFEDRVIRLRRLIIGSSHIAPQVDDEPTLWLLGAGSRTGALATQLRVAYAHAASFHKSYADAPYAPQTPRYALSYFVDMSRAQISRRQPQVGDQRLIQGEPRDALSTILRDTSRLGATDVLLSPTYGTTEERRDWLSRFAEIALPSTLST